MLGIDTEEIDDDDFEDTITAIPDEEDLYVRFRTWGREITEGDRKGEWRVYTVIEGPADDYEPEEVDDMSDESDEDDAPPAKASKSKSKAKAKPKKAAKQEESDEDDSVDPVALGAAAAEGDDEAEEALVALAEKFDIDHEAAETWEALGAEVAAAMGGDSDDGDDSDDDASDDEEAPEEGDVVGYKPPRARKEYDCEVVSVNAKKQTATLKNLDNDKEYKNVSWDKLAMDEE